MECNKRDANARQLTYVEFLRYYVWKDDIRKWAKRVGQRTVGRINFVAPKSGESYYLRILLNKVRGATCFEDIRTVDNKVYGTFKDACFAIGLLSDDSEYIASLKETHEWASGEFCHTNELREVLYNLSLAKIETRDEIGSRTVPNTDFPKNTKTVSYRTVPKLKTSDSWKRNRYRIPFGSAFGTGTVLVFRKTFVWKTLAAAIRSRGEIPDCELAALLNKVKLIIWDEAPLMHIHYFEAFDRTMRDIIRSPNKDRPFGGKVVVFGGDFH
ncbi:uncharacterized protein [Rutidosis leptorrhynchoides]|uniref:uncharacterized protein n=1 Tax=Rutidosis leptorrhynchoides TaxID=125765 RepID=UPI003A995372